MKRIVPVVAALALGVSTALGAQDATDQKDASVTKQLEVDVEDGKALTLTGCLVSAAGERFSLQDARVISSDGVKTTTRVERDVNDDGVQQNARTETEHAEDPKPVGTSGLKATYHLVGREGLDLASHVGKQVQVTAVELDPSDDKENAQVTIVERTTVEREGADDSEVKTKTEAEIPRGTEASVTVVAVQPLANSCN